jgi:hypothetical protein
MTDFIFSQLSFYSTLILVLFVPGIFLLLATRMYKEFSLLELLLLAFGSSIAIMDFMIILLGRSPLHITRVSILAGIAVFAASSVFIYYKKEKKLPTKQILEQIPTTHFSKRATILIVLLLFLSIFIKTIYFKDAIFPTATDLGHHMYWTKTITTTGQLPVYEKSDIGQDLTIGKPLPIADFIIGEHLIFAAIALISGAEFMSAFPVLVLLLVHIMSILAIFVLTRALFEKSPHRNTIAITALFLIGPLFAIASPQAKFISGGVIGNDISNLLIPIAILLYLKAFSEKKSSILALSLFMSLALAYTHHLSTFVFIFISIFTFIAYAAINFKTFLMDAKGWLKMAISPQVLSVLAFGAIFVFLLYMPTYLNTKAIDTAVGAPSKATRTGLTIDQLKSTAGEARYALAIIGMALIFFAGNLGKLNQAFLIGWTFALTLMSLRPDWLFVDIPSNRIASYIVYPSAILAAYVLVLILATLKSKLQNKSYLNPLFLLITFFLFFSFISSNGFYDNAQSLNAVSSATKALQTYAAAQYLGPNLNNKDLVLKDHNYLAGDSWIKLFFMKGYNYPLSRGFFKRYEDTTKTREQCTNFMISAPNGIDAQKCYAGTGTNFIMIDPKIDAEQFKRSGDFWQVYASDAVGIFYKVK